jgi:hypothetical protein
MQKRQGRAQKLILLPDWYCRETAAIKRQLNI